MALFDSKDMALTILCSQCVQACELEQSRAPNRTVKFRMGNVYL